MSLESSLKLIESARAARKAVPSFNIGNMETLMGVIKAAEELNEPIIIQMAEVRLKNTPLHLLGPMLVEAAKNSKVSIGVQYDHGFNSSFLSKAVEYGFTSIMFDGSRLPLAENIAQTKNIVAMASKHGVAVEAEIGVVGGSEGGAEMEIQYSNPDDAFQLANSGCSMLAVAIGNAHGAYKGEPKLNFDILAQIAAKVSLPLVLHGGSGLSRADFHRAIELGVCKINIAHSTFQAAAENVSRLCRSTEQANFFKISETMSEAAYENAKKHIRLFRLEP